MTIRATVIHLLEIQLFTQNSDFMYQHASNVFFEEDSGGLGHMWTAWKVDYGATVVRMVLLAIFPIF